MTTEEFTGKVAASGVLCQKMAACKTPEEAYAAAREIGLTDDFDTFQSAMAELHKRVKGELSDSELDRVAVCLPAGETVAMEAGSGAAVIITSGAASAAI